MLQEYHFDIAFDAVYSLTDHNKICQVEDYQHHLAFLVNETSPQYQMMFVIMLN